METEMKKNTAWKGVLSLVMLVLLVIILGGLTGENDLMYHLKNRGSLGPLTREDIEYKEVEAPEPTSKDGTVNAADWAEAYPEIVMTMGQSKENSYVTDYLEQDPYLVNIYEGYGFSKDYGSARGHEYCLEDVAATERPHPKANCLTCKSPNYAKLVNDQGVGVYKMEFDEVLAKMEENPSCYTCHGNNAGNKGELVVTHSYVWKALGEAKDDFNPSTLSCGQCHIEYYFTPEDNEAMMPYHDQASMTPQAILDYYDSMGFYDWEQESTGAKMLKAQHPEFETFTAGKHAALLSCADCHMPIEMAEDGTVYHNHKLISPIENETSLSLCATCHGDTDMVARVHEIQDTVTTRETEVGNKLSKFKDILAQKVKEGEMSEEELDQIRQIYREAQWFFDFCYVENSEGAHNSELSMTCLKTAEDRINRGMTLMGMGLME